MMSSDELLSALSPISAVVSVGLISGSGAGGFYVSGVASPAHETRSARFVVDPRTAAAVAAGGVIGAGLRWFVVDLSPTSGDWPWGVLLANVIGSAVLGLLIGRHGIAGTSLLVGATTGLCGALTTFSAFAVDLAVFLDDGRPALAASYLTVSLLTGLAAVSGGLRLGRALSHGGPG